MSTLRTHVLVLGLAALASSCDLRPAPEPAPTLLATNDVPPCEKPGGGDYCGTGSCGANAPTINGFPINGLRANGECNKEGVQLVPGSLAGGATGRCAGATLDYEDNHLVGRAADGSIKCRDKDLVGATFEVRSWVPRSASDPTKLSARIRIDDANPHSQDRAETRIGYSLREVSSPGSGGTLCGAEAATRLRGQLGLKPTPGLASPSAETDVVIPVASELYDNDGSWVPVAKGWRDRSRTWLNLACAGDALAKRSLYQLYSDSTERSRANLRMLTANYCGDRPLTMRGMLVRWVDGTPERREAQWSSDGATCLEKPRVIYRDSAVPQNVPDYLPPELKKLCGGKECASLDAWIAAAHQCGTGNDARTIPRCPASASGPTVLPPVESFVEPPGTP
jgi:hypothetical protein